ncbi:heat stress transcription factor C-2a-like [Typha latifolia]|uniref:heat stress transcription factor C-2a-like n=1 Tax=Typha latifolia TaxID=4733 RepID=UPI003C3005CF
MMVEDGSSYANIGGVAPFVIKTYRMVSDSSTDSVISWGRGNNSFVVVDPFAFSQTLLPAHFKHNNFSSFVRQLNTYGFRKVDPDRWEFAHASFLRGQTHLLRQIVRRNSGSGEKKKREGETAVEVEGEEESRVVAMEVVRLKQEQREIEEKVEVMWRRVQETEKRPKQMLAFLIKVAGDPLGDNNNNNNSINSNKVGEKRARLCLDAGDDGIMHPDWPLDGEGIVDAGGFAGDGFIPTVDVEEFYDGNDVGGLEMDGGSACHYSFPLQNGINGF